MSSHSERDHDPLTGSPTPELITRREAIQRVTVLLGGIGLVGGDALLTGCAHVRRGAAYEGVGAFTPGDIALLDEVAETILPETDTPGAKAAEVGPFMALMVTDVYREREQAVFMEGMERLEEACREMHGASFMNVTPEQRLALLERLDREQVAYMEALAAGNAPPGAPTAADDTADPEADPLAHYFRMMKELALLGYFTSEIGYMQAMRYAETPGRFDPCVPHAPGERIWAPHV